jgi:hypothetical protein
MSDIPRIRFVEPEDLSPEELGTPARLLYAHWFDEMLRMACIHFGLPAHLVTGAPPEPEADTPHVVEGKS